MREALADPERPLRRSTIGDDLSVVARAQTLAVLEGLHPDGKGILLQFLYESNLIKVEKAVISLVGANLQGSSLGGAYLDGADLDGADLAEAYLEGAYLHAASLRGTEGLIQEQPDPAYENEDTERPDYLRRPEDWGKDSEEQQTES